MTAGLADRGADVAPVEPDPPPSKSISSPAAIGAERLGVVEIGAARSSAAERHAAVHRPGVEVGEAERRRDPARDGRLAGPGGAVDRDHHGGKYGTCGGFAALHASAGANTAPACIYVWPHSDREGVEMQTWDLGSLDVKAHQPEVITSDDEGRAIVIELPAGEELGEHQVHERAWVLVVSGEVELTDSSGESGHRGPGPAGRLRAQRAPRGAGGGRLEAAAPALALAGRRAPERLAGSSSPCQVGREARVADRGRLHPVDLDPSARGEAGDRAEHRDPVVAVGVDRAAAQPAAAARSPSRRRSARPRAPSAGQRLGHGRDPVGLLAAQLAGVADHRLALGEAGGERDQRQLVDRQRDLVAARPRCRCSCGGRDA